MKKSDFTFSDCIDVREGCVIYYKGNQIARTVYATDNPKTHNKIATKICTALTCMDNNKGSPNPTTFDSPNFKKIDRVIAYCMANLDKLNQFEHDFVISMSDRLAKYGDKILMSDKQMKVIDRMVSEHDISID